VQTPEANLSAVLQRLSAQAARNPTLQEAQQRILKLSKVQP
jgi:hypothetical protein